VPFGATSWIRPTPDAAIAVKGMRWDPQLCAEQRRQVHAREPADMPRGDAEIRRGDAGLTVLICPAIARTESAAFAAPSVVSLRGLYSGLAASITQASLLYKGFASSIKAWLPL
jgi:hypothetical protein